MGSKLKLEVVQLSSSKLSLERALKESETHEALEMVGKRLVQEQKRARAAEEKLTRLVLTVHNLPKVPLNMRNMPMPVSVPVVPPRSTWRSKIARCCKRPLLV